MLNGITMKSQVHIDRHTSMENSMPLNFIIVDLYQKIYDNNKTIPVILVGVLAGLLITATTAMMPSNAFAKHHYHNKIKFEKEYRHKSEAVAASSAAAAAEEYGAAASSAAAAAVGGGSAAASSSAAAG